METTPTDPMAAPPLSEGGTTTYRELNRDKTRLPRWMDDVMHRKPRWASDAYNDEPSSVTEGVRTQELGMPRCSRSCDGKRRCILPIVEVLVKSGSARMSS